MPESPNFRILVVCGPGCCSGCEECFGEGIGCHADPCTCYNTRRVLVFGGRDFHDSAKMEAVLRKELKRGDTVVHGGARGADALAGDVAGRVLGYKVEVHQADWHRYGKSAGPIRNQRMLDSGIDYAIGFPGGKGTDDMAGRLVKAGVRLLRVESDD